MPKTKKVSSPKKKSTKKVVKTVSAPSRSSGFSQDFNNTMLVILGASLVILVYALVRL